MNADPKIISGAKAVFRSLGRLAAGMLLGAFVILTLAITSGFMLSHDRLNHVARKALNYGDLSFSDHPGEDYFTECGMLIMQYLRHDNVFLNSVDSRFIHPLGHPCQDLKALVAPAVSSQVKSQKPYSYPSYPFGSRYLEAWVLSFVELRDAKTLYALLSYASVGILFLGAWRNSPVHLWSVLWICLFLLFGFSMHRFGHNLAHAPGFFVGFAALGFFLATRERFRDPANRIVFFGFLGILLAFFDLLHGSIPVVLSLSIVLNHLFYVQPEAQPAADRSPFSYLFLAIQQALVIFVCFLVSYGVFTGLRILLLSNVIEGSWPHYIAQLRPRLGKVVPGGVIGLSDVIHGLWVARFQLTPGGVVPATRMLFVSLAAWIFAICLLPVAFWRQGSAAVFLLVDIFVVAAAATGVLAWYWLFPNHTYVHTFFMVRIVALPASYGLVAATIVVRFLATAGSDAIRWAFTGNVDLRDESERLIPGIHAVKFSLPKFQLVLVLILAAFSAGGVALTYWALTPSFYFEVSMRSSSGGLAQTFYDVGRGISELDSARLYLQDAKSTAVYRFPLPETEYKTIRFDPLDHGNAHLVINYARIVDMFGHTLRRFSLGELRVANGISAAEIKDGRMSLTLGPADNDSNLIINPGTPLALHMAPSARWRFAGRVFLLCFLSALGTLWLIFGSHRIRQRWLQLVTCVRRHPYRALLIVATISTVLSCYPVAFFEKSFVSPNNGVLLLYDHLPTSPGYTSWTQDDAKGADLGGRSLVPRAVLGCRKPSNFSRFRIATVEPI